MILSVYADGSSHARGGKPGGWAWVAVGDGIVLAQGAGGDSSTTNNVMELTGAIKGLEWVQVNIQMGWLVELVSDSQYTLGMANGAWTPNANQELVKHLRSVYDDVKCWRTRWVPGHTGDTYNEMCDKLAKAEKTTIVSRLAASVAVPSVEPEPVSLTEERLADLPDHQLLRTLAPRRS